MAHCEGLTDSCAAALAVSRDVEAGDQVAGPDPDPAVAEPVHDVGVVLPGMHVGLAVLAGPEVGAAARPVNVRVRGRGDPPVPALTQQRIPQPANPGRHLIEATIGRVTAVATARAAVERAGLVAWSPFKADVDLRCGVVAVAELTRRVLPVDAEAGGRPCRVMGDHQRLLPHVLRRFQELDHLGLGVAARVGGEGIACGEAALQLEQLLCLIRVVRDHQCVMVQGRGVELHSPELEDLGYEHA